MISTVLLAFITVLGFLLRSYDLTSLPISLFGDEVDVGYHSWSLITTGKDYMGNFLPTYIQSLSEYRAPLLMYITAPFVGIFGPSTFSVRLPELLLGTASIVLIYFIAKILFQNKTIGIFSSFILAITPWHIHYSRAAFEVVLLVFLLLLGTYLFIKNKIYLSVFVFGLTFYTYSTANIFTPLLVLSLLFIYRPKINPKKLYKLIPAIILMLPMTYNILWGNAANRFGLISIFNDSQVTNDVVLARTQPWVNSDSFYEKIFHNKYTLITKTFFINYLSALSTNFLFVNGDPYFRHSVSKTGEFLWPTLIIFCSGLYFLIKKAKSKESLLLLSWLLLSPIPSSLTQSGGNHATRLFVMIPAIVFISANGWFSLLTIFQKKYKSALILISISIFLASLTFYLHRYTSHYKYESANFWDYGYENIFHQLAQIESNYDTIYINNNFQPALLRFAFFTKLSPADFHKMFTTDNPDSYHSDNFDGFKFGNKYYFGTIKDNNKISEMLDANTLYLAVQGKEVPGDWNWSINPPSEVKIVGSQSDVFKRPLFYLVTSSKKYN